MRQRAERAKLRRMQPAVYILAGQTNGTLYVHCTSNLVQRVGQHREHLVNGFTHRHGVTRLVCYQLHATMESAITREQRIKKWARAWKVRLIEETNPQWYDLWEEILGSSGSPPEPALREGGGRG